MRVCVGITLAKCESELHRCNQADRATWVRTWQQPTANGEQEWGGLSWQEEVRRGARIAKTGSQDWCAVIFSLNYVININIQTFIYAHWGKIKDLITKFDIHQIKRVPK